MVKFKMRQWVNPIISNNQDNFRFTCNTLHLCKPCINNISSRSHKKKIRNYHHPSDDETKIVADDRQYQVQAKLGYLVIMKTGRPQICTKKKVKLCK
jgi:hypothetical protein